MDAPIDETNKGEYCSDKCKLKAYKNPSIVNWPTSSAPAKDVVILVCADAN